MSPRARHKTSKDHRGGEKPSSEVGERILDATRSLLIRGGWEAVTISAICDEADVYASAVHYHFGSKEELIAQVLDRILSEAVAPNLDALLALPVGRLRLRRTIEALHLPGSLDLQLAFYETLGRELLTASGRERIARQYEEWFESVIRGIGGNVPDDMERLRPYARLLAAVFEGVTFQRLMDPANDEYRLTLSLIEELVAPALERLLPPESELSPNLAANES